MNRQEFEDTARRYREELFRMYASQNITPQPKPQAVSAQAPDAVPVQNMQPPLPQEQPPADLPPAPEPAPPEPAAR